MDKFIVGVPYSNCQFRSKIPCTREDEAIAIAAGASLCGRDTLVFMQNSGIGNSIDVITSLLMPYKIDVEIVYNNRTEPEQHRIMGERCKKILEAVGYDKIRSDKEYIEEHIK